MNYMDVLVFLIFVVSVMALSLWKSGSNDENKGSNNAEDYFLAGRGLSWWLIGFSLIAANISAEQFVGMSGQGAGAEGLSCASWEWIAVIALIVIAFSLLPYFLRSGITTIPEFLEIRYNHWARALMTISMMGILIVASLIGVTYAGSLVMMQLFHHLGWDFPFWSCCLIMGLMAGIYVLVGGLRACAWADLLQGSALLLGGALIAYFTIRAFSSASGELWGWTRDASGALHTQAVAVSDNWVDTFRSLNADKMKMGRPATDVALPWTILLIGIWIPNFYYWGLNQYITQRILGSGSLAQGQRGIVLAAIFKLFIPFIIIIPGIVAFNLFAPEMKDAAEEDFRAKYIIPAEQGTLSPDVRIDLGATPEVELKTIADLEITPAQVEAVRRHNEAIDRARRENADAGMVRTVVPKAYKYDTALGLLITKLIPKNTGILGFILAALLGAIVSSLAAVLNATSTLFTMDIYKRYINVDAEPTTLVNVGRASIVVLLTIGVIVAALLETDSIFAYIQQMQLYVSPGIVAIFIFGLINRRGARWLGALALILAPIFYFVLTTWGWAVVHPALRPYLPIVCGYVPGTLKMHYLWAAAYTLILTLLVLFILGIFCKLPEPIKFQQATKLNMKPSRTAFIVGIVVVLVTVGLYVFFW